MVNVGDKLRVEIADIDSRGKISLVPVDEEGEVLGEGQKPSEKGKKEEEGRRQVGASKSGLEVAGLN